jgi:hypothetical protein
MGHQVESDSLGGNKIPKQLGPEPLSGASPSPADGDPFPGMNCPVCDLPYPPAARHCPGCGFPVVFAGVELPAQASEPETGPADGGATAAVAAPPRRPQNREEEANASLARALEDRMNVVRMLGGGAPDVTGALCEAALSEASGQVANASQILRSAEHRLEGETQSILHGRLKAVEERVRLLENQGLRLGVSNELARLSSTERAADPGEAVVYLLEVEKHVGELESTWSGLQGLLDQIAALKAEADRLGIPYDELPPRLDGVVGVADLLNVREETVDELVQSAAQGLMTLHDALLPALESELDRHGASLHRLPSGNAPSEAVRRLHETARRHLKEGRISDAARAVVDLRRALAAIESRPSVPVHRAPTLAPPPVILPATRTPSPPAPAPAAAAAPAPSRTAAPPPAAPAVPATPEGPEMLASLVKKAQGLAGRVRLLPADSELARWAAEEIRGATELLRHRHLAEADEALTNLMNRLASAPRT